MTLPTCICTFFVCVIFSGSICSSQTDTSRQNADTIAGFHSLPGDSVNRRQQKLAYKKFEPTKKPWVAVGLSAALPGLGQVYDESYWKIPVIWGLGGYWVYEWIQQNKHYQDYRQKYSASITSQLPSGDQQYLNLRDFYRNERDSFAWYLGALYFLNLVDAYVGANLYDFNVTPDLSMNRKITPKVSASIKLRF